MKVADLNDRDLKSLVKFGSDERIVAQARAELTLRGLAHNQEVADSSPAPIPPRGRWDS